MSAYNRAHQLRIDIDLAHVVDDDSHTHACAIAKDSVEKRGFARSEEAGEDSDRETIIFGGGKHSGLQVCNDANVIL